MPRQEKPIPDLEVLLGFLVITDRHDRGSTGAFRVRVRSLHRKFFTIGLLENHGVNEVIVHDN
jgi:hypothetical protein